MFDFNIPHILFLIFNTLLSMAMFIISIVYFFIEARNNTIDAGKRTVLLSSLLVLCGAVIVFMTRFFIEFPEVEGYDMNSNYMFVIGLFTMIIGFFTYILYLRCGEHFARLRGLPGSSYLKGESWSKSIDWKLIILPVPILIAWTFIWFSIVTPEPTELIIAATPEGDSLLTYVYFFLSVSIVAPIQEEILYRHFAMGILYRWFGRGRSAVLLNIGITAVIFSVAHISILTVDWLKFVQILPAGFIFGYIYHKRGLEHSIIIHALFNTLIVLTSFLFS